jgi:hypothetical protein
MMRKTPTVWVLAWGTAPQVQLRLVEQSEQVIEVESEAWWAWLELPSTRSFAYPIYDSQAGYIHGFMTVRKEWRTRGSEYWVAYRRLGKQLRKIYLGRAAQLTQQQLGATAERFLALEVASERGGRDTEKEVMLGQIGDVSLKWEVMMRRVKCSHQMIQLGR